MTIYITDSQDNVLVDIFVTKWKTMGNQGFKVEVFIDIEHYSCFLLGNIEHKDDIIAQFKNILSLDDWAFDHHLKINKGNTEDMGKFIHIIDNAVSSLTNIFDLYTKKD